MNNVDATLYRPIKDGNQYNKYFTGSTCEVKYLGTGDTSFHVKKMKAWAKKYAHHTKELAKAEFANKSLQATVAAIHNFLYWHIQYKMDGVDQNLKSPACAWATRSIGLDCKSYSIFASTILQNLGIKHYFRKVKQPFFEPDLWSHVYVIIPKNQKTLAKANKADYFVLDATVKDNQEVMFSKYKDEFMSKVSLPAYGLAAPGIIGKGLSACACTKNPINSLSTAFTSNVFQSKPLEALKGLGASGLEMVSMRSALDKFQLFLSELVNGKKITKIEAEGVNKRLTNYFELGINPRLSDLFAAEATNGLDSGLGFTLPVFGNITAPTLTSLNQLPATTSVFNTANSSSGFLQSAGNTISQVSGVASIISSIIPTDLISKTFGQVFANGLNFKCFGSSWTPTRAEEEIPHFILELERNLNAALTAPASQLEVAINSFFINYPIGVTNSTTGGTTTLEQWIGWLNDTAKDCTKDGLKALDAGIDNWLLNIQTLLPQIALQLNVDMQIGSTNVTFYRFRDSKTKPFNKIVPQVRVTPKVTTTTSDSFVDANDNVVLVDPDQPKSSLASVGVFAGVAIGAIALTALVTGKNPLKLVKKQN